MNIYEEYDNVEKVSELKCTMHRSYSPCKNKVKYVVWNDYRPPTFYCETHSKEL